MELLEDRRVLASYTWDGGPLGTGTLWSDVANWDVGGSDPAAVPGKTDGVQDDVTIDLAGANVVLDISIVDDGNGDALNSFHLNSATASLTASSRTLTVDGASTISAGTVNWTSSTWTGGGSSSLTNQDGMIIGGNSIVDTNTFLQSGSLSINGGVSGAATLTSANGFTNDGTIILETIASNHATSLIVNSGTLLNNGVLTVNEGTGGTRTITTDLSNPASGDVNINTDTTFSKSTGLYLNSGDFNIAATATLTINANNQEFEQNAGTLDVQGAISVTGATFSFSGGTITGGGSASLLSSNVAGVGTSAIDIDVGGASVGVGASPGIWNVLEDATALTGGNWIQSTATTLAIEIGGAAPGTGHDQLNIEGNADLSGTVNLSFINSFAPHPCQTFEIITYGSRSGSIPTLNVSGLPAGFDARVDYGPTVATAVVFSNGDPINVHPTTVSVAEDGSLVDSYSVCLASTTPPSDVVTVNVLPDVEVNTDAAMLLFDPATTWALPQTVNVTAVDDAEVEGDHIGVISHTATSTDATYNNATISDVTANITDNDTATISLASAASNAPEATTPHTLNVLLSIPGGGTLGENVSVQVDDISGSASEPADYSFATQTITFLAGSGDGATQQASMSVVDDANVEGPETVDLDLINLTDGTGGQVSLAAPDDHTVTIVDDDTATIAFDLASSNVSEATATHDVAVSLSIAGAGILEQNVSVDVADLMTGSASTPADYVFSAQTLTFSSGTGSSTQNATISIVNDTGAELPETIDLELANLVDGTAGQASITPGDHQVTIDDNDASSLTIDDEFAVEGSQLTFTVTLSTAVGSPFTVDASFADGQATGGSGLPDDFDNTVATLNFNGTAGETRQFMVDTFDDVLVELSEDFSVMLTASTALVDDSDTAIGTITDNDTAEVVFVASSSSTPDESSGPHLVPVRLDILSTGTGTPSLAVPVTVDVTDAGGGSAASTVDYSAVGTQTLTFPGGTSDGATMSATVTVIDDLLLEGDETVNLQLDNVTGPASLGSPTAHEVTILDDESVQLEFVASSSPAAEAGGAHAVEVVLAGAPGVQLASGVTVSVDTEDAGTGTASSGPDYTAFGYADGHLCCRRRSG